MYDVCAVHKGGTWCVKCVWFTKAVGMVRDSECVQ